MKRFFNLPALCGLLVAAGVAITVRHAAAAPTWDGAWGEAKRPGEIATCTHSGTSATGGVTLNGNDNTQGVAWCSNYNCGRTTTAQYLVKGLTCTADGACEEAISAGPSVGSTTGGGALTWLRCQMGSQPPPPIPN